MLFRSVSQSRYVISIGGSSHRWWNMQAPLDESPQTYTQVFKYNLAVNLLPLAAYQKIYQDFFRWSQWENADPTSYNFDWYSGSGNVFGSDITASISASNDYWKRDNLFSLRYCNWNKDMFGDKEEGVKFLCEASVVDDRCADSIS